MKTKMHYSDTVPASLDSPVYVADVRELLKRARKVLPNLRQKDAEEKTDDDKDFQHFVVALYESGMVMSDFNAPVFDSGPGQFISNRAIAEMVVKHSNLTTIRMFLHTLARGHRATWMGYGYPYFSEAFLSGGLQAIFNRLEEFCKLSENKKSNILPLI